MISVDYDSTARVFSPPSDCDARGHVQADVASAEADHRSWLKPDEFQCDFEQAAAACVLLLRTPTVLTRALSVLKSRLFSVGGTHGLIPKTPRI